MRVLRLEYWGRRAHLEEKQVYRGADHQGAAGGPGHREGKTTTRLGPTSSLSNRTPEEAVAEEATMTAGLS